MSTSKKTLTLTIWIKFWPYRVIWKCPLLSEEYTSFNSCYLLDDFFLGPCVCQMTLNPDCGPQGQSRAQQCSWGVDWNIHTACFLLCLTNQWKGQIVLCLLSAPVQLSPLPQLLGSAQVLSMVLNLKRPTSVPQLTCVKLFRNTHSIYSERLLDNGENNLVG